MVFIPNVSSFSCFFLKLWTSFFKQNVTGEQIIKNKAKESYSGQNGVSESFPGFQKAPYDNLWVTSAQLLYTGETEAWSGSPDKKFWESLV